MREHPFRLRRIEMRDFKSVASASVELHPLTVVVGANSSGKSTLLQSILALAQAVRSDVATPELPLNGEFVRLGSFDETRNFLAQAEEPRMSIGFSLVHRSRWQAPADSEVHQRPRQLQFKWHAHLTKSLAEPESVGFARIEGLQVEVQLLASESGDVDEVRLSCDLDSLTHDLAGPDVAALHQAMSASATSGATFIGLSSSAPVVASGRVTDWTLGNSAAIDAVALSGGLPTAVLRRRPHFEALADIWWDVAWDLFLDDILEQRDSFDFSESRPRVSYRAAQVAAEHIQRATASLDEREPLYRTDPREIFLRYLAAISSRARTSLVRSLSLLDPKHYRRRVRKDVGDAAWVDRLVFVGPPGEAGDLLLECGAATRQFFDDSIRYLGPLREAPHVLYDPGPSKLDLGVKGEYSAAVLHAQAQTPILMPTPHGDGEVRTLSEALDFWLREFELADEARSKDEGRMGIGLNVVPKGVGRPVDLTSVGVGVSQVLPVLLLCLLAQPGTLVVLEQPELHLHPKLQSSLADFLLACTRAGRQLVVETHSEHLVNRLRYQIAGDDTSATHDLIGLVFAENCDGITSYREPKVNEYGGLGDDWPAGFLDLTARESQELVRQSLAKRKRIESSGAP